tara:strand:- start:2979 stop:3323 length:345 start_codon:yes stop_codon:yes gene_type:complete
MTKEPKGELDNMSWKEQVKIEKGLVDKTKGLIKRIRDASFKRKLKKFLADNLNVKYERHTGTSQRRVSTKSESLDEAKEVLLDMVEEVFDEVFPEIKYDSPVYNPNYIPLDDEI